MNMDEMTLEEKLEYYRRQTHQLKKRRDDAIKKINYLNSHIKQMSQDIKSLDEENEDLKEDNAILKQALTRLVESFNDHISDKSPVKDLIK